MSSVTKLTQQEIDDLLQSEPNDVDPDDENAVMDTIPPMINEKEIDTMIPERAQNGDCQPNGHPERTYRSLRAALGLPDPNREAAAERERNKKETPEEVLSAFRERISTLDAFDPHGTFTTLPDDQLYEVLTGGNAFCVTLCIIAVI